MSLSLLTHSRSRLVNQVDGLVGQEAVVDVLGAGLYGKVDGLVVVFHIVELLVSGLQLPQDMLRLVDGRLGMSICWKRRIMPFEREKWRLYSS